MADMFGMRGRGTSYRVVGFRVDDLGLRFCFVGAQRLRFSMGG